MLKRSGVIFTLLLIHGCASLSRPDLPPQREFFNPNDLAVEVVPHEDEISGRPLQIMWQLHNTDDDNLNIKNELFIHYQNALLRNGILFEERSPQEQRRIEKEIERAIFVQGGEIMGRPPVDYYLRGTLVTSIHKQEYDEPMWCPFCEENRPGTCEYEVEAELKIDVYEIPSRQRLKSWSLKDDEQQEFDAKGSCRKPTDGLNTQALYERMRNEVTSQLKKCSAQDLRAYFSPEAYLLHYYSDGKKHYYEISGGEGAGFKKGQNVKLLRMLPASRGGGSYELGNAKVTSLVEPKRAIIEVTDAELIEKLNPYDKVKVDTGSYSLNLSCMN